MDKPLHSMTPNVISIHETVDTFQLELKKKCTDIQLQHLHERSEEEIIWLVSSATFAHTIVFQQPVHVCFRGHFPFDCSVKGIKNKPALKRRWGCEPWRKARQNLRTQLYLLVFFPLIYYKTDNLIFTLSFINKNSEKRRTKKRTDSFHLCYT